MKIFVSVCIPVVKSEFLKKSIQSCLIQSYENFELIILNNAINEKAKEEIRGICNLFDDFRIKYHENECQIPMIDNWNKCLSLSNGDYFSILCDDDVWHKDFLINLVSLSQKYPLVNVLHSKVAIINSEDKVIKISEEGPEHQSMLNFIYSRISNFNTFFLSDFLLKTTALKEIGGFVKMPSGWGSDDITYYNLSKVSGVAFSNKLLFSYRDSPLSITNNKKIEDKIEAIDIQIKFIKSLIYEFKADSVEDKVLVKMIDEKLKKFETIRKSNLLKTKFTNKYKLNKTISFLLGYLIFKLKYANL